MPMYRVRVDNVYVKDFYHNRLGDLSICIDGTVVDPEGQRKLEKTGGRVQLEYTYEELARSFNIPSSIDPLLMMQNAGEIFEKNLKGRIVPLRCEE